MRGEEVKREELHRVEERSLIMIAKLMNSTATVSSTLITGNGS